MLIEDKHSCNNCEKEFDWYYHVPQKWNAPLEAVILPTKKANVQKVMKSVEKNGYRIPLIVSIYCPNCGFLNTIDVKKQEI